MPFAEPVTEAVRRNDVEHLPGDVAMSFDAEVGDLLRDVHSGTRNEAPEIGAPVFRGPAEAGHYDIYFVVGWPGAEPPRNSLEPSGRMKLRPTALLVPSFAR